LGLSQPNPIVNTRPIPQIFERAALHFERLHAKSYECGNVCHSDREKHTHKHTHKKSARCNLLIVLLFMTANMAHPVVSPMHDHAPRANQRANAPCFVVTMRANAFDLLWLR
jgi:hypothetical protein